MNKHIYTDEDEEILILSQLIRFADHNPKFKRKYIDDVYDFFDKYDYITGAQMETMKKIYDDNDVEEFFYDSYE